MLLLLLKRKAIGALIHLGVALVSTDLDLLQSAIVFGGTVVSALGNSALDAFIGSVHSSYPPFWIAELVCADFK